MNKAIAAVVVFSILLFMPVQARSQTCSQSFVLRQETCPAGIATCTTKPVGAGNFLTYAEADNNVKNTINLCNGPGKFTWPATGAAGIFSVTSGGVVSVATDDDTPDSDAEVPDVHTVSGGTITSSTLSGTNTVTGTLNLDSGTEGHILIASSATLPATCAVGDLYFDTDADSDGSLYICRATNIWKEVDDDGGAGGGAPTDAVYLALSTNATLTNERVFTSGLGLTATDSGAGSAYTLAFITSDTLAGNPTYSAEDVVFTKDGIGGGLLFEGSTADAFEGILQWNPTTSDKTLTIPDVTGTLITSADTATISAAILGADSVAASELDATAVESELEAVIDLPDLQGSVTDAQVPNTITVDTATSASGLACTTCVDTADIANDAVTYAKIQNITTNKLLGRSTAGSGDIEEITIGTNLTLSSGTLSVSGGGAAVDPLVTPDFYDELCTRHTGENVYGHLGWRIYGSNGTSATAETNHPCIQTLFTTTVSGNIQTMGLGRDTDSDLFRVSDLDRAYFVIKLDSVSNVEARMGFLDTVDSTTGGDGFFIELDTAAGTAWRCVTRQGGTTTATANAAGAVVVATWYQLEIERDGSGNHKCYVNGTLFATHTTNLPTGLTNLGFMLQTNDAVQKVLQMDAFRLKLKTLTRY
jgi:hypothetical protein